MDYETLKEHWSEVEDRDGVRLSWNVFPTSRMVCTRFDASRLDAKNSEGSIAAGSAYWCSVHAVEGETRYSPTSIRACDLQTALSLRVEPILVSVHSEVHVKLHLVEYLYMPIQMGTSCSPTTVRSMFVLGYGSAHSVCRGINSLPITRTSPRMPSPRSCTRATRRSNTDFLDLHLHPRFSFTL
jgi:hypothetical protein